MMNLAMSMNHAGSHSVCSANTMASSVYLNAACFFSALRFRFYCSFYFPGLHSSERQQIS